MSGTPVYQFQNVFSNLYMTANNTQIVGEPLNPNSNLQTWNLNWNSGGGPGEGGNWTIQNRQTCAVLTANLTGLGQISQFNLWPQKNASVIQITIPNTFYNLGLYSQTAGTPTSFMNASQAKSVDQLLWVQILLPSNSSANTCKAILNL